MINNLTDVVQNIADLLELKKERLRKIYKESETLKSEILELEVAKTKLESKEIHLAVNNLSKTYIPRVSENIASEEILSFITSHESPVSIKDMKDYFKCKSSNLTSLYYLVGRGKVVKDGITDDGRDKFSLPVKSVNDLQEIEEIDDVENIDEVDEVEEIKENTTSWPYNQFGNRTRE